MPRVCGLPVVGLPGNLEYFQPEMASWWWYELLAGEDEEAWNIFMVVLRWLLAEETPILVSLGFSYDFELSFFRLGENGKRK